MTTTTTTTMTVPAPAHLVAVVSDGYECLAECGCGWASDRQPTPDAADTAGAEHCESAIGPPDEMDLLMSGLLDLQDDLAATVVWLAENWSAHLPSLGWYANGSDHEPDRPALRVLGACNPVELAAAAAVLDSALTDDPPNDSGSARYRRATRDIGRVRIEVFTSLAAALAAETAP
jgi:hypothetical protein